MSHQHDLLERVKAMFSTKFFNNSPQVRELESGDFIVNSDITIVTNDENRELEVTMMLFCDESGILSRTILKLKAPSHAYKRVVRLITQINSRKPISCFEFDYRDGEIAAQNFLQCTDYVPSIETIYNMIYNANSKFMEYGDRLIEAMGMDTNTLEVCDHSKAKDVLDEALKGHEDAQQLLLAIIKRDPESNYYHRLKEAANDGNELAQKLLAKTGDNDDSTNIDIDKVKWPIVMLREELLKKTLEKAGNVLLSAKDGEIPERDFYIGEMNSAHQAISGDIRACDNVGGLFVDKNLPQLFDPQLAYHWYGWAMAYTNEENWGAFHGMPGNSSQGVSDSFHVRMAEMVLMYGTKEQKYKAVYVIKDYVDKYWAHPFCEREKIIYALLGIPTSYVCRELGYNQITDGYINRELAIEYYKRMIDDHIAKREHDYAKSTANTFEPLLGIKYYNPGQQRSSSASSTSSNVSSNTSGGSSGGCYIATCVYGSYDCPEVWTLRRFRDNSLAKTWCGRTFIRAYYAISPHIVKIFGKNETIRKIWEISLNEMVRALNEKGYQNTPYKD